MLNLFCLRVLFFSVISVSAGYAYSVVHASDKSVTTDEDTVESLSDLLQNKSLDAWDVRLSAIRKLGLTGGVKSRKVLMKHFRKLPQALPSTHSRQTEKIAVMRALIRISEHSEIRPFMLGVLKVEINAMRKSMKNPLYPQDLTHVILSELEKQGITEKLRDMLADHVDDHSLPQTLREACFVPVILYDLDRRGLHEPGDKAVFIAERIVTPPDFSYPWDIYADRQKRIEYGKTEAVKNKLAHGGFWNRSDEAVLNAAYEKLLRLFGMTSVEILVAVLDTDKYDKEKKAYFMVIASDILRKTAVRDKTLSPDDEKLMRRIRENLDNMEDTGVFGRRYNTARNLKSTYITLEKEDSAQHIESEFHRYDIKKKVIRRTSDKTDKFKNKKENIQAEDDKQSISATDDKQPISATNDKLTPGVQKMRLSERVKPVTEQKEKKFSVIYIAAAGLFIIVFALFAYALYRKKRQF